MSAIPSVFGLKGMAIAFVAGGIVCGFGAYKITNAFGEAHVLRLEKSDLERTIANQGVVIGAYQKAASDTAALDLAERQRARFAQSSLDAVQKETDDAVAAVAHDAACDHSPPELVGLRNRLR